MGPLGVYRGALSKAHKPAVCLDRWLYGDTHLNQFIPSFYSFPWIWRKQLPFLVPHFFLLPALPA